MLTTTARNIADAVSGQLVAGNPEVTAHTVAIDSRDVTSGSVFVALKGERVDGHDFAHLAAGAGATVIVVSNMGVAAGLRDTMDVERTAVVLVEDCFSAVQALAVDQRTRHPFTVVGITGSTGKTSVKSFVASVLATKYSVVATEGNQNNELGCPLTILRANEDTQVIVVEMGMRGPGEIAELAAIARPQIGVVTNVGPVHLETLGTVDAVADAKGELLQALPIDGLAVIEAGTPYEARLRARSRAQVVSVGATGDIVVTDLTTNEDGLASAVVHSVADRFEPFSVTVPIPGVHHLTNALFAVAVGVELGVPTVDIARGIAGTDIPGMRFARVEDVVDGVTIINDAYNANPTSMEASVRTFSTIEPSRRHIAVLGDMLELGEQAATSHARIGEICAEVGCDIVVGFGDLAVELVKSARERGVSRCEHFGPADIAIMVRAISSMLMPGDIVLLKGSRGMALERVIEMLASGQAADDAIGAPDVR